MLSYPVYMYGKNKDRNIKIVGIVIGVVVIVSMIVSTFAFTL